jgi:excisionase family DNA binding protein
MSNPDDLLTIGEAARLVGLSRESIREAVARGTLPSVAIPMPAVRIRRADILAHRKRTRGRSGRPQGS